MPGFQSSSYEEIPYASGPISTTHPDNLAAIAIMAGLDPPDVGRCRVLELGCASGGNLIPMAMGLPGARFLGVDLSPRQVADGRTRVEALGLSNIELQARSIADLGDGEGPFDYIVCHGVYSWVPEAIREKILEICAACLAERGVAYVSYNTYPGWHGRGLVREMMGFHVHRFDDPHVRLRQARGLLDFLVKAVPSSEGYYGRLLAQEAEVLGPSNDSYIFHEHLEEENHPFYVHQFVGHATAHGLHYLGEAKPSAMAANLSAAVREEVAGYSPDPIEQEQYLDFIVNRTFRRTLLCRASDRPDPGRRTEVESLSSLRMTAIARPVSDAPDLAPGVSEEFRAPGEVSLATDRPLVKAILVGLAEAWPRSLAPEEIWERARDRLGEATLGEDDRSTLAEILLRGARLNLLELHAHPPAFATEPGECPTASPLARLQAEADEPITNLRHRQVNLDAFQALALCQLDGRRDRAALIEALAEVVASGNLDLERDGQTLHDPAQVRAALADSIEPTLRQLARNALLLEP